MRRLIFLLVMLVACARSETRTCGQLTCAPGRICGELRGDDLCLLPGQDTACGDSVDGTVCAGDGFAGICDGGYCLPGCGDGVESAGEECDDGNFESHDGCSSSCRFEVLAWNQWEPPAFGRSGHAAVYDAARGDLLVIGGFAHGVYDDQWKRATSMRAWSHGAVPMRARAHAAVAYDSIRNRVVLFGGSDGIKDLGDTWEYDGTTWTDHTPTAPAATPSPRSAASMVFDEVRGKMVLFGGSFDYYDDTWEYDDVTHTWTQISTTTKPPGRNRGSMAWDAARKRVVLFGGLHVGIFQDTWEYDAGTWTEVTPTTSPDARFAATMEYFPERGHVVLTGGTVYEGNLLPATDTWEFLGTTWSNIPSTVSPPARAEASLTYDAGNHGLVLVGGTGDLGQTLDDVWELSSSGAWSAAPPRLFPSLRQDATLVYDPAIGCDVLFGGIFPNTGFDDTWKFDGESWQEVFGAKPTARYAHGMAYDAAADRAVMFGGQLRYGSTYPDDTCEWRDGSWTCASPPGPAHRVYGALADAPGDGIVLFGGNDGGQTFGDTWKYASGSWTQLPGAGGPPAERGGAIALDPTTNRTIMYSPSGTTWTFDGASWATIATDGPPPRYFADMSSAPWGNQMLLYGGVVYSGANVASPQADLWELDDAQWHAVVVPGLQPQPRSGPAVAALPALRALVLVGGQPADGINRSETWLLRYRSDTPDEICDNALDDDGDLHVDADDPDCP